MAYSVARELHVRPMEILTEWSCEELLVAYGVYANSHSKESYDNMPQSERRKKGLNWLDRWAVPFVTRKQAQNLATRVQEENTQAEELAKIHDAIFS